MKPTDDDIAKAKEAHPGLDLHLLPIGDDAVIARTPSHGVWRRFVSHVAGDKAKAGDAMTALVSASIVWPAPGVLDAMIEKRPGIVSALGAALSKLAGADEEIEAKKL